ncbi:MAG TPA: NUDIX domain-containing protein [Acidimicrobiales bacterium]|nr:NUDIX domain-containing protein [Acidimicrobiales bacterium]
MVTTLSDIGSGPPDPNPPTPAATVVCLRDGAGGLEVLLLRRRAKGAFGGFWVFPGGKVDPGDVRAGDADELAAARRAAVREAAEEAAVVLDESAPVPLSWWMPPHEAARRFATWFFLAAAPSGGSDPVVLSEAEVGEHRWITPAEALAAGGRGELALAPPTWMTLWWVGRHAAVADALAAAAARPPERFTTRAAAAADGTLTGTVWEGDVAYDDLDFDPERPGPRRRLLAGPDGWQVVVDVDGPPATPGPALEPPAA